MPLNSTPCTVNAKNFDAKRAALVAAVIGTAIVQLIEASEPAEAPSSIARFIKGLRTPVLQAR